MKIKYFPDTDTIIMEFNDHEVHETREISENVYIDLDEKGGIVAMTIEHARGKAQGTWEFSYQEISSQAA